jgi:hypothetical protein
MSTLGFGDIIFTSDVGRLFSMIVLLSGVVFLLVMLPVLFIRLFYAPWLEARVRMRAPRRVPADTAGHVIIAEYDAIAVGLIERLRAEEIPYYVIEPDPTQAAKLVGESVWVVAGENDSRRPYEAMRAEAGRLVLANCEDTVNTNITLTTREVAPDVSIAAIAEEEESIDILQLAGATTVLPLTRSWANIWPNRVAGGRAEAHVIGALGDLRSHSSRRRGLRAELHDARDRGDHVAPARTRAVLVGQGVELFTIPVPASLAKKPLKVRLSEQSPHRVGDAARLRRAFVETCARQRGSDQNQNDTASADADAADGQDPRATLLT